MSSALSGSERRERAARAAWAWAEDREVRMSAAMGQRRYEPVAWEDADELDRAEYLEYIDVVMEALDG